METETHRDRIACRGHTHTKLRLTVGPCAPSGTVLLFPDESNSSLPRCGQGPPTGRLGEKAHMLWSPGMGRGGKQPVGSSGPGHHFDLSKWWTSPTREQEERHRLAERTTVRSCAGALRTSTQESAHSPPKQALPLSSLSRRGDRGPGMQAGAHDRASHRELQAPSPPVPTTLKAPSPLTEYFQGPSHPSCGATRGPLGGATLPWAALGQVQISVGAGSWAQSSSALWTSPGALRDLASQASICLPCTRI